MWINETYFAEFSDSAQAHYEYSPFGKIYFQSGTYANENPFRFYSEYFDSETSLVYYNYRYYSPESGRWLSRDPIEERGGENLYAIVKNAVINFYDLWGLSCCCDCLKEYRDCLTNVAKKLDSDCSLCDTEFNRMVTLAEVALNTILDLVKKAYEKQLTLCKIICFNNSECYNNCSNIANISRGTAEGAAHAAYASAYASATAYKIACYSSAYTTYIEKKGNCYLDYISCKRKCKKK